MYLNYKKVRKSNISLYVFEVDMLALLTHFTFVTLLSIFSNL